MIEMADVNNAAEDILLTLLQCDHVDEVALIQYGFEQLDRKNRDKFVGYIKEAYKLHGSDECPEPERDESRD
jgi:hypothetical protein